MSANTRQVGGQHYVAKYQHWDLVLDMDMGYLEGNATKYVARWRKKNGISDLQKAAHYLEKLCEVHETLRSGRERVGANILGMTSSLYRFNEANRLWHAEAEFIRVLVTWSDASDLEFAKEQLKKLLHWGNKGTPFNLLRDPESAADASGAYVDQDPK